MLKKLLSRFLVVMMVLLFALPALAEGTVLLVPIDASYEAVNEVLYTKERILLHSASGMVYGWQMGQEQFEPLFDTPMLPED